MCGQIAWRVLVDKGEQSIEREEVDLRMPTLLAEKVCICVKGEWNPVRNAKKWALGSLNKGF